jgi:hypothetical protein
MSPQVMIYFNCLYQSQINKKWDIARDLEFLTPVLSLCVDGNVVLKLTLVKWHGGGADGSD